MIRPLFAICVTAVLASGPAHAAEWRVQRIDAPARVTAVRTVHGQVRANAGGLWYGLTCKNGRVVLTFSDHSIRPKMPQDGLADGRVAIGERDIARAWLAEPTGRYDHGTLGDKVEAASLAIETRDGARQTIRLPHDAVFEDLEPRLADLDGDGRDEIVVVKSYLARGAALAVIAARRDRYRVVAETPPIGEPRRWLDPAGIADFTGDGKAEVALVRLPHRLGRLELWQWHDGTLHKAAELEGFANHVAGSRAIAMSAVADFDGDGIADLVLPSFSRDSLRIVTFTPRAREIANVPLPAKAMTDFALIPVDEASPPLIALGLDDGSLVVIGHGG
jgi:hypothetical protein